MELSAVEYESGGKAKKIDANSHLLSLPARQNRILYFWKKRLRTDSLRRSGRVEVPRKCFISYEPLFKLSGAKEEQKPFAMAHLKRLTARRAVHPSFQFCRYPHRAAKSRPVQGGWYREISDMPIPRHCTLVSVPSYRQLPSSAPPRCFCTLYLGNGDMFHQLLSWRNKMPIIRIVSLI